MADEQTRNGKPGKTRRVEYYRLWAGKSEDSGTWDTDFLHIPADARDDTVDNAIRRAAGKIKWRDDRPVIVGYYGRAAEAEDEADNEDGGASSVLVPPGMTPEDRDEAIQALLAKAEAAGLQAEDLDESVHELASSIAADVNNSGMDGQLAYLVGQMGGEAVGKELDRLATEKAPGTTAAGHEQVCAECHSDDRIYSAEFNAVRWFEQAKDDDILQLAQEDWGDGYAADEVGMFMADSVADVQKMFDYLEHYNQTRKKPIDWVCTVDKADVPAMAEGTPAASLSTCTHDRGESKWLTT